MSAASDRSRKGGGALAGVEETVHRIAVQIEGLDAGDDLRFLAARGLGVLEYEDRAVIRSGDRHRKEKQTAAAFLLGLPGVGARHRDVVILGTVGDQLGDLQLVDLVVGGDGDHMTRGMHHERAWEIGKTAIAE